jgi:ribosomal protein S18 acetylase RimI-like enzyme
MQKLREMQPEDIKAVIKVIESQDEDDAEEALESYQQIGGIIDQYVLEQNGQIIGVTGFLTPPACDQTHLLSWTYVHDDYANQGHGRIMLNELIDFLKEKGGRKLFVRVSDYVDEDDGAIYAAALHLYRSLGFKLEITHKDYYDEGEAQMILGLRLKEVVNTPVEQEHCPAQFNSVFEIAETDDAYSFGWDDEGESLFTIADVEIGLEQVKNDEGRAVFLSFPSNYSGVADTLLASGFINAGTLDDYFEDGVHEQHFAYRF